MQYQHSTVYRRRFFAHQCSTNKHPNTAEHSIDASESAYSTSASSWRPHAMYSFLRGITVPVTRYLHFRGHGMTWLGHVDAPDLDTTLYKSRKTSHNRPCEFANTSLGTSGRRRGTRCPHPVVWSLILYQAPSGIALKPFGGSAFQLLGSLHDPWLHIRLDSPSMMRRTNLRKLVLDPNNPIGPDSVIEMRGYRQPVQNYLPRRMRMCTLAAIKMVNLLPHARATPSRARRRDELHLKL